MPSQTPPCCPGATARHLKELPHVYQFDLDLLQCDRCSRYWVLAWREDTMGWEPCGIPEAQRMLALEGTDLRTFVKSWAISLK